MLAKEFTPIPITQKLLTHIFSKIKISTEHFYKGEPCWEWQGRLDKSGYGHIYIASSAKNTTAAHRMIYQLFVESVAPFLHCDHLCRRRHCVNPVHIEPVTFIENLIRSPLSPMVLHQQKTHCKNGHPFNKHNTKIYKKWRQCKQCRQNTETKRRNLIRNLSPNHPRYIKYQEKINRQNIKRRKNPDAIGNKLKTHCPQGHPYNKDNVAIRSNNRRVCKECGRQYMIRKRLLQKTLIT